MAHNPEKLISLGQVTTTIACANQSIQVFLSIALKTLTLYTMGDGRRAAIGR